MTTDKTDWEKARKEYVQGITQNNGTKKFPTYKQLAKTYGITEGTIKNKASEEKWVEQRKRYKYNVTKKAQEKKGHDLPGMDPEEADEAAEIDAEAIIKSDQNFEKTGEDLRLRIQEQLDRLEGHPENVNPYHLKMMGDALKAAQDVVKTSQEEFTERIKLDSDSNVNLSILDDEFNQKELEFMQSLIKKD